jgi:hypothetical protein
MGRSLSIQMAQTSGGNKKSRPVGAALLILLDKLSFLECLVCAVLGDSAETLCRSLNGHSLSDFSNVDALLLEVW